MPHPTQNPARRHRPMASLPGLAALVLILSGGALAAETNLLAGVAEPVMAPDLPDATLSFFRVLGALALVIALFLGGVWLYRNWQRLVVQRGRAPRLNVLEVRSLGGRHAIYVVGYDRERFLLSSSPAGMNMLSHLPAAEELSIEAGQAQESEQTPVRPSFAQVFQQVLKRR